MCFEGKEEREPTIKRQSEQRHCPHKLQLQFETYESLSEEVAALACICSMMSFKEVASSRRISIPESNEDISWYEI